MTLMHLGSTKVMTPSELCRDRNSVGTDMPFMSMHTGELVTWGQARPHHSHQIWPSATEQICWQTANNWRKSNKTAAQINDRTALSPVCRANISPQSIYRGLAAQQRNKHTTSSQEGGIQWGQKSSWINLTLQYLRHCGSYLCQPRMSDLQRTMSPFILG